jgi:predicted trehalose synthase
VDLASQWYWGVRDVFLDEYLRVASQQPGLLPADVGAPLAALELEKAAYEVMYELNNRPDWLPIPLAAFTGTL